MRGNENKVDSGAIGRHSIPEKRVVPSNNVVPQMNNNTLMNVMRIMDDHEKMLNFVVEEDKQDENLEFKPTAQLWYFTNPVAPT